MSTATPYRELRVGDLIRDNDLRKRCGHDRYSKAPALRRSSI